jgi:hypothetical protein
MTLPEDIRQQLQAYFERQLTQSDENAKRVGWNGSTSQHLRFEQVMRIVREPSEPFTLLDWGCGLADLIPYLDTHNFNYSYTGYDLSQASLAECHQRYSDHPRVDGFTDTLEGLEAVDYVVSAGIFNVRGDIPISRWEPYVLNTLSQQWALAQQGMAANFLTSYSDTDRMEEHLYYPQPEMLFSYAKRTLSRNIALLHDYDLYDFTLLVRGVIDSR